MAAYRESSRPGPPVWPMYGVMMLADRIGWRDEARCRGDVAAYFYPPNHFERKPEKDRRESVARAVCAGCPVRLACLEYALAVRERHGIWGGLNELERRRLLQRREFDARIA